MFWPSEILTLSSKFKTVTKGLRCQALQTSKQYFGVLETRMFDQEKKFSKAKQKVKEVFQGP